MNIGGSRAREKGFVEARRKINGATDEYIGNVFFLF